MSEAHGRSAAQLRAMGIQHELIDDDDGLVEMVQLLIDLGVELVDMIDEDLTFLGAPRMIRPDASIEPSDVFSGVTDDPEFRSKAALALGYNFTEDTRLLTPDEVATLEFFDDMRDIVGDDDLLSLLRVMGSSMGRLSRSVISLLRLHYETPILEQSGSLPEVFRVYQAVAEQLLPPFLDAAATILRRHIAVAAASPNVWNTDGSRVALMERASVGFADLVGFTSFTERADLKQFVTALRAFESQAQEVIVGNGGTLVKLIGDEVMFVAPTAASAVEVARRLAALPLGDSGPGSVRIGLATGDVVAVDGDFYGTVVNIASRAVQEADPDTIVVTAEVANGAHASTRFESIGTRQLRGISEPIELYKLL